jgi:hypothetical protein
MFSNRMNFTSSQKVTKAYADDVRESEAVVDIRCVSVYDQLLESVCRHFVHTELPYQSRHTSGKRLSPYSCDYLEAGFVYLC